MFLVGCELRCCCVNRMWLAGVARDVLGGVLWRGFLVLWVAHIRSQIFQIQSDCGKKHDTS